MRKSELFFTMLFIFLAGPVFSQEEISGNLFEISKIAFEKSPTLKRNIISLKSANAELQAQTGAFDYYLNSELSYRNSGYHLFNTDPRNQYLDKMFKTNNWDFDLASRRKLRSGQSVELGALYGYNNSNSPFNDFSQEILPYSGDYSMLLNLSLVQPLLRGRGKSVTSIPENTSVLQIEFTKNEDEFSTSFQIMQVAIAYWNYYKAYKSLEIYRQNEERIRSVLEMTQELIKADKKPESEIDQIKADLSLQEEMTLRAEQTLFDERLNLGRKMGLSEIESRMIKYPADEFPSVINAGPIKNLNEQSYADLAIENRADLAASEKALEIFKLQYQLAKDNGKPQLDLTAFGFYGNASQGNSKTFKFSSLAKNEGRYAGGGIKLTFTYALNNNYAIGMLNKSKLKLQDEEIVKDDIKRNIQLNVSMAISNLKNSLARLDKSKYAQESYRKAFENEQTKFKAGLTTLLNLILFQERLTSSELGYLQAQQEFAISIINVRHETGTLVERDNNRFIIKKENFNTIPYPVIR